MRFQCALLCGMVVSCGYVGAAHDVKIEEIMARPGWVLLANVPFVPSDSAVDAGPAALSMVLGYWQTPTSLGDILGALPRLEGSGLFAENLRDIAEARGLTTFVMSGDMRVIEHELLVGRPIIVGVIEEHRFSAQANYEVVVGFHDTLDLIVTLDPRRGYRQNSVAEFQREWDRSERLTLVMLPNH